MASSKIINRKRKANNCVILFDGLLAKFSKLSSHSQSAEHTSLKLLDLLCTCQNHWSSLNTRLGSKCKFLQVEVDRLKKLQDEMVDKLNRETECRRRAERARDSLRRKIDAIREVLTSNDVDEAKRRLNEIELSALTPNKSLNNTRFDHSAGSLLDPVNVSAESSGDEVAPNDHKSQLWNRASASSQTKLRTTRLSKFRSSSVPKFTSDNGNEARILPSEEPGSAEPPRVSRKRNSINSDDSYFGVEVKRSLFTLPPYQSNAPRNVVPSTVTEEDSSSVYSSDAVMNAHLDSDDPVQKSPANSTLTPKVATISRLNRPHDFVPRSVLRMDTCSACGRRIAFGKTAYKCAVCRLLVHPACQHRLVQTCVPPSATRTPLRTVNQSHAWATSPRHVHSGAVVSRALVPALPFGNPKSTGASVVTTAAKVAPTSPTLSMRLGLRNINLTDFCPVDQFPRIPALIIHCVTEVVARGMNTVGIYRVSGSEKQVRDLYDKFFRSKMTPGLALVDDIHVVCGCLKLFLRNLSEPLVTFEQRPVLAKASERMQTDGDGAVQQVLDVLDSLPTPNRDTLAYIMLHLKLVARTPACQMGEDNLAKVFGPTLVGYSCPEPQLMQTVNETRTQKAVLKLLFSVPDHVYSAILSNPPMSENSEAEQDQATYFSPLSIRVEPSNATVAGRTPMRLRQTPRRLAGLDRSSHRRFLPSFLSSNRVEMDA